MELLEDFLKEKGYRKVNFKISKTQHLLIKAKINGVEGNFILDTGASNSCIDYEFVDLFKMQVQESKTKAAGAGATGMPTKVSDYNIVKMGRWEGYQIKIIIFDLSHVNQALSEFKVNHIHGIIGADVLMESQAVIDYKTKSLYLMKQDPLKKNLLLF